MAVGFKFLRRSVKVKEPLNGTASGRYGNPESTIDGWANRLSGAIGQFDKGVQEYNRVYHSRKNLLRRICELSISSDRRGLKNIVRDLASILEDEGVVRFDPEVGGGVPRDKCASTPVPTAQFPPGLVVYVESPGYITADGQVIVKARVGESVNKVDSANRQVVLFHEAAKDNVDLLLAISVTASANDPETGA